MTTPATVADAVQWQYFDVSQGWLNFGPPFDLGSLKRTRRAGIGPRKSITAQRWRLVKLGGQDWGTSHFAFDAVRVWSETDTLSAVRVRSFSFDEQAQRYFMVHTAGNIEVYHGDVRVASIATPFDGGQVLTFTQAQVLDTQLQFHQRSQPLRITRQGAHEEWDVRPLAFDALPVFDYDGTRAGGVNEVQQISFKTYVDGDTFNITLEGQTSDSVVYSSNPAILAPAIQSALEALPNVGAGGVTVAGAGTDVYQVTFAGNNGSDDIGEMAPKTLVSTAGLTFAATITQGQPGGEAIVSDARGWPATGCFYQGRLYLAGLKSRPQTILGSRIGSWFNFKTKGTDKAISEDLDTDETTPITGLFPGQHLQVFSRAAEFFFPTEPITPPAGIKRATRRGLAQGVPLAELPSGDGAAATLFVTNGGTALAEFLYDGLRNTYSAQLISKLATHLLTGAAGDQFIVDMGFRRAKSTVEADRALLVRSDGVAAVMHALRDDDVTGFVRWTTQGQFLSAAADLGRDEYVAVQRGAEILLEKIDPAAILDSQVVGGPGAAPLSAPHLAGRTVALYIDGSDAGDAVVGDDGTIALPRAALRQAFAGLLFTPRGITLPAVLTEDQRKGLSMEPQVGCIDLKLGPTANLRAGIKGGTMWRVPLKSTAAVIGDEGPGENPFEGWTQLLGLDGFQPDAQCEFVQDRPGPLEIREIVLTIDS